MIILPAKLERFVCECDIAKDGVLINLTLFYPRFDLNAVDVSLYEAKRGMTRILENTLKGEELTLAINNNPEIKISSPDQPSSHPDAGSW